MQKAIGATKQVWALPLEMLMLLCMLTGCGGGGGGDGSSSGEGGGTAAEEQVVAIQNDLITAYKNKDLPTLMAFFSTNYLDDGDTYTSIRDGLTTLFNDPNFVPPTGAQIISTDLVGDQVYCLLHWDNDAPCNTDKLIWRMENGAWKLYGNRQHYRILISSRHQQDMYSAMIEVVDTLQKISSVNVTGPGLSGPVALVYSGDRWGFSTDPVLGASVPTAPQSYIITIVDGSGTYQYTKTITGYVEQTATKLSPSGTVSNVTFVWTGISGACGYGVQLNEGSQMIWKDNHLPNTTTSLPYTGPALTPGLNYTYSIFAYIQIDDQKNWSRRWGNFTYQP